MTPRRPGRAGLVALAALTAALGSLLMAQSGPLTHGAQAGTAALAAQVTPALAAQPARGLHADWPPPYPSGPWYRDPSGPWYRDPSGPWYPDPYPYYSYHHHHRHHHHRYYQYPAPAPSPSAPASPAPSPVASPAPSPAPSPPGAPTPAPAPGRSPSRAPRPPAPGRTAPEPPRPPASSSASPVPVTAPAPVTAPVTAPVSGGQSQRQSRPVTLTVRTLPALPDVQFSLDGQSLVTDARGEASFTEPHDLTQHRLTLLNTSIVTRLRHYRFTRWAGERDPSDAFRAGVTSLPMRANYTVTAAFTVQCPVRPRFTDQYGRALNPGHISRVVLKSSAGRQVNISPTQPSWLDCVQPVYRNSMLSSHDVNYAAQAVMFAKANIVYAGVERFSPREQARPTFVGYFHNLTITAHDALFGGHIGSYAVVTLPGHRVRRVALGPSDAVTLDHLPQGDYQVDVRAGGAIVSASSFRLSRTKTVNLTAVSAADLATVGGGLLLAGGGLPLLATTRRKRLLGRLRPGRPDPPKGGPA